jgi:hypothetical protein
VTGWLCESKNHVFIGEPNAALKGSGFEPTEKEEIQYSKGIGKYLHFRNKVDMDRAIKSFPWIRGKEYVFGYHESLLTTYMTDAFQERVTFHMASFNITVRFEERENNILTFFLSNIRTSNPRNIKQVLDHDQRQQSVYIGPGTVWDKTARDVSLKLFAHEAELLKSRAPELREDQIPQMLETFLCRDDIFRRRWQSAYASALAEFSSTPVYSDGCRYVYQISTTMIQGIMPGGRTLRPDLLHSRNSRDVPLNDIFRGVRVANTYEMAPGLMRLEAMLSVWQLHAEVRYEGTIDNSEDEKQTSYDELVETYSMGVDLPGICLHHGMVPYVTQSQKEALVDVDKRAYVLASFGKYLHPCCINTMMNQGWSPMLVNYSDAASVNPTTQPEFDDARRIINLDGHPYTSTLWSTDRLVWSFQSGVVDETYEHRTQKYNMPGIYNECKMTLQDCRFIDSHPGGTLDHMLRYISGAEKRSLGLFNNFSPKELPGNLISKKLKSK